MNKTPLEELCQKAIDTYPEKVKDYKNGKTGLLGLFMGETIKLARQGNIEVEEEATLKGINNTLKRLLEV